MSFVRKLLAVTGLALALAGGGSTGAFAQASDPFAAAKKLSDSGKYTDAVGALSRTLNSGTLSPDNTARGFYLRGMNFGKAGKNPQAISDLTNALWLSGLSGSERASAYRMRAAAYKASGFKRKAAADLKRAQSSGAAKAVEVAAVTGAPPLPKPSTLRKGNQTTGNAGSWTAQTASSAKSGAATPKPAVSPTPAPGSGSAVSSFFSNLFSGETAARQSQPKSTQPVRTAAAKRATKKVGAPAADTAISSWSSSVDADPKAKQKLTTAQPRPEKQKVAAVNWSTNTAAAASPKATKVRRADKTVTAKKPATKKAVKKGRFNVQVATVRDRATAEKIKVAVAKQAPKALRGLKPSIDTAVLGNMGTFFRVRVDGLPTRQASSSLCRMLSKQGHDCFLLTR